MAGDYKTFLAAEVLSESKIVCRLLLVPTYLLIVASGVISHAQQRAQGPQQCCKEVTSQTSSQLSSIDIAQDAL